MIFAYIFIFTSLIHLYASITKNKQLRNISKVFIIPSLILLYSYNVVNGVKPLFILALIFSWLGDVFLIFKGIPYFSLGGLSFGLAHVFFILSYIPNINLSSNNIYIVLGVALVYLIIIFLYFSYMKKYIKGGIFVPMVLYLISNASMNCFALAQFLTSLDIIPGIIYIGAILFFISDCKLFQVRFANEESKQNHFLVMLTYILAEYLIVLGMTVI